MSNKFGWIAVDFDGTLAMYDHWRGPEHLGEPIPLMVERVKGWSAEGREVRIFTARVGACGRKNSVGQNDDEAFAARQRELIGDWCELHIGKRLDVTATKDFGMVELYDDRCVQVRANTGRLLSKPPKPIRVGVCERCGIPLTGKRADARFCSKRCNTTVRARNRRAKEKNDAKGN